MSRTKSDRADWNFTGDFSAAMVILTSGIRPDDGQPLTGQDATTILKALTGDNGTMTAESVMLKGEIQSAANRSAAKAAAAASLATLRGQMGAIRSAVATYKANVAVTRAENASERNEKRDGNAKTRFIRAYKVLLTTDPDFLKLFKKNPAQIVEDFDNESADDPAEVENAEAVNS